MAKDKNTSPSPRACMELAIEAMNRSQNEPRSDGKVPPKVGAVILFPDGHVEIGFRGELRDGDHAEFTLLERKLGNVNLEGCILFTTLEPCVQRNPPKVPCCGRTTNARIKTVYVGITDPDPTVDGKGIIHLETEGVTVTMFDRDLQETIRAANYLFIEQALMRKKAAEEAEQLTPLERMVPDADWSHLSEKALKKFVTIGTLGFSGIEDLELKDFFYHLHLLDFDERTKEYRPTGLGLLLFGKKPRMRFPQAAFMASVVYGNQQIEPATFEEALVLIPDAISEWLLKVLPLRKELVGFRRVDLPDFPLDVLREAIVNAIVHRDYTIEGAKSSIEIDPSSIVVRSPGEPLNSITMEQLNSFKAPSISRNPVISYIFSLMNYVEEKGFGMRAFRDLHEKNGFPVPHFTVEDPFLVLSFPRDAHALKKVTQDFKTLDFKTEELEALAFAKEKGQFTRLEFQMRFGLDKKKAERQIGKLEDLGLLERQGAGRSTFYKFIGA